MEFHFPALVEYRGQWINGLLDSQLVIFIELTPHNVSSEVKYENDGTMPEMKNHNNQLTYRPSLYKTKSRTY